MALVATQAEHDALAAAIKQGVLSVAYSDKKVTYQSADVMRSILAEMAEHLLGALAPARSSRARFNRG